MKRFFALSIVAMLFGAFAMTSCNKAQKEDPTEVTVTVADVTAAGATVNVSVTGAAPQMVRFIAPVAVETLDFDITDAAEVAKYASKGEAIGTPYSSAVKELSPVTEYFTAAVAFDANFQVVSTSSATFTTLAPDNAIGENNGAGEIKNDSWQ